MNNNNQLQIRNSTVDFLIFTRQNDEDGIAVRVEDENVWLRSEAMAMLFNKDRRTIQDHLRNIFADGELDENSVCRKFRHTADETIGDGIGNVSHEIAKTFAESEFEKYRVIQDKTYQSDFDRLVEQSQTLNLVETTDKN